MSGFLQAGYGGLMRQKVLALQDVISGLPQIEMVTHHHFADGMYCRELHQPAGTLVVGKTHKREHFFILTNGRLQVAMNDGTHTFTAPTVIVSKPGAKRALFALEDSTYVTVHRTKKKNLDKIEKELIEETPEALFDSANKLKVKELP